MHDLPEFAPLIIRQGVRPINDPVRAFSAASKYVVVDDEIREELDAMRFYIDRALAFGKAVAA